MLTYAASLHREYSYVMEKMSSSKSRDFTLGGLVAFYWHKKYLALLVQKYAFLDVIWQEPKLHASHSE
jgi:hypothetical protein